MRRDANDPPASAQTQFERQAVEYAASTPHATGESLAVMSRLAAEGRYARAVDIATGAGFIAFAVAPCADRVLATDVARGMLEQVRRLRSERGLSNVGLALARAEALPFRDGSFDLATCRTAPHHFLDIPGFLAEVARVLAPEGTFLLADTSAPEDTAAAAWQHDVERRRDSSHGRNLSPSEWKQALAGAGLEVDHTTMTRVDLNLERWARRSGTPPEETERLREAWRNAPPSVVEAFRIKPAGDGNFTFSWPCLVARARKNASAPRS